MENSSDSRLTHPFERWPALHRRLWFLSLVFAFIVTELLLQRHSRKLKTDQAKHGIASFQLAGTVEKSTAVINSWEDDVRISAQRNLQLDFPFLIAYSTLFAATCVWGAGMHRQAQRNWATSLGLLVAWGQWVAALFDAVENFVLLKLLASEAHQPWPRIAQVSAIIKYILVLTGLIYICFGGALYWLLMRVLRQR